MRTKNFKMIKQVIAGILCVVLIQCPVFFMTASAAELPQGLYARGAVLMDAHSGRVLFSKSGNEFYPMASTTKIMTCILALELGKSDQIVTFSDYAASMPDVQMNARAGEQYYLKDLLYSLMLESHNDSAVAIAEAITGDTKTFAELMDRKAEAIGCTKTNFVTPNGLDGNDEGGEHGTTAKDLALIIRYCVSISPKAEAFIEISKTPDYEFGELQGKRQVSCHNHNAFLNSYEGAFSGKTGFTGKAGYCYTGAAKRDDRTLVIALLGSGWYPHRSYKWRDAEKLFDYGFENFHYAQIGKENWQMDKIPVIGGMKGEVSVATDAGEFQFLLENSEEVKCKINCAESLKAPVEKETVVGTISYELNGSVIEQFQIYTEENVEKSNLWNHLKKCVRSLQTFVKNMIRK